MINLPQLDLPNYLRGPKPCNGCRHSFHDPRAPEILRCGVAEYTCRCTWERDGAGDCGPEGKKWEALT